MAVPGNTVALNAVTALTATGTAALGAVAGRFSVQVVTTSPTVISVSFAASADGTNFSPVVPAIQRGSWYTFDVQATSVQVSIGNNTGTTTVNVAATA